MLSPQTTSRRSTARSARPGTWASWRRWSRCCRPGAPRRRRASEAPGASRGAVLLAVARRAGAAPIAAPARRASVDARRISRRVTRPCRVRTIRCAPASSAPGRPFSARSAPLRDAYARFDQRADRVRRGGGARPPLDRSADVCAARTARPASTSSMPRAPGSATSIACSSPGLVDGEWPDRPRRNIFYSPAHPARARLAAETDRRDGARAAFADLLRLPRPRSASRRSASRPTRSWAPSTLLDELATAATRRRRGACGDRADLRARGAGARAGEHGCAGAARSRSGQPIGLRRESAARPRFRGFTDGHRAPAYLAERARALSGLPVQVLRRRRPAARGSAGGRVARSRRGRAAASSTRCSSASSRRGTRAAAARSRRAASTTRARCSRRWPSRCWRGCPRPRRRSSGRRLFGSAICGRHRRRRARPRGVAAGATCASAGWSIGSRATFSPGVDDGAPCRAAGASPIGSTCSPADRLRVIDYKTGYRAERQARAAGADLRAVRAGAARRARRPALGVDEAAYVAFTGKRSLVPVVKAGDADAATSARAARATRLFALLDGIGRGEFPPRPHDPMICRYCAYASVCRKDYVGDE